MKNTTSFLLLTFATMIFSLKIHSQSWSMLTSGITASLLGVSIVDDNICYASGSGGQILKTIDGGLTWTSQVSGTTQDLYSIDFTDASNGVAVGNSGVVRRTINGGTTWMSVSFTSDALRGVSFYDSNVGYIVGGVSTAYGSIFKTIDGGASWTSLSIASTNGMYGIKFTSSTDGYVSDFTGAIFKTINGGTSWSLLSSGTSTVRFSIDFPNSTNGVVVGGSGVIRRTTDGGGTWSGVLSGTSDSMTGFKFADVNNGFAVGGNVAANTGIIVSTTNGGASWSTYTPGCSRLYRVDFLNTNLGYAVGLDGTILKYSRSVEISEQNVNASLIINPYPNPASGSTIIDLSILQVKGPVSIELFDVSGKLARRSERILTDQFYVSQDNLSKGEYFFNVLASEQIVGRGKIIFK